MICNLLHRSNLAPEESSGINALNSCFGSIWNSQSHCSLVTWIEHMWPCMIMHGSENRYLFDGQIVIGRQTVVSGQGAVVGGASWDKVVQQILTGHEQTGEADQSHMDPLVPPETTHLYGTHYTAVSHVPSGQVHDMTVTVYSPGPADRRNPSFYYYFVWFPWKCLTSSELTPHALPSFATKSKSED